MRYRVLAVVAAAIALSVVVATATASRSKTAQSNTLTVWLQVDAQNGWPQVVAAANNAFENSHPGWNVNVQYQSWGDHLQKFDATIAANQTPDVIEMGNTEMTKYMAAGAFANITANKGQFDNSGHWLAGLKKSSMFNNKLYGVPYYAGSRLVTYRTDLFKKAGPQEGSEEPEAVRVRTREGQGARPHQGLHAVLHGGHGLVQRPELRLRLRRVDRQLLAWQVARGARHEEVDRGAQAPTRSSSTRRRPSRRRS